VERNPYSPPESNVDAGEGNESAEHPGLGGCLIALLIVMIVGNAWMMVIYSLAALGKLELPGRAPWIVPTFLAAAVVNITALAGIFNSRRWGMYLAMTSAAVIFVLNLVLGVNPLSALLGLIGPGLLLLLIRPMWKYFR